MIAHGIDGEADDLGVPLVELRLQLGHVAELGGADRREILGVREEDRPAVAEPFMEIDLPWVSPARNPKYRKDEVPWFFLRNFRWGKADACLNRGRGASASCSGNHASWTAASR
jgi:hypothetical protein